MSIEVSPLYLDAVLQVLETLVHEVDDDAVPVDAQAVIEETQEYLRGAAEGAADAGEESKSNDAVEEEPTAEAAE